MFFLIKSCIFNIILHYINIIITFYNMTQTKILSSTGVGDLPPDSEDQGWRVIYLQSGLKLGTVVGLVVKLNQGSVRAQPPAGRQPGLTAELSSISCTWDFLILGYLDTCDTGYFWSTTSATSLDNDKPLTYNYCTGIWRKLDTLKKLKLIHGRYMDPRPLRDLITACHLCSGLPKKLEEKRMEQLGENDSSLATTDKPKPG